MLFGQRSVGGLFRGAMASLLHDSKRQTHPSDRIFFIRRLEERKCCAAPYPDNHQQLFLRAAGVLFYAAQKMVSHLSGERLDAKAIASAGLFNYDNDC